ncbi:hypothetical protein ABK040_006055 [Willaertia magna]
MRRSQYNKPNKKKNKSFGRKSKIEEDATEVVETEFDEEKDINKFVDFLENDMDKLDEYEDDETLDKHALSELYGEDIDDDEEDEEPEEQEEEDGEMEQFEDDYEEEKFQPKKPIPQRKETKENIKPKKNEPKTLFELEQERILSRMEELEGKKLEEKDWQEIGEADATKRPANSLIEEAKLTFEHAYKAKPVVTEEVTKDIESIIISRIVSGIFDDPIKPDEADKTEDLKEDIKLEHEKSKKSLAQIYEEMYLRKVEGVDLEEEEKKEDPSIKNTKQKVLKQVSDLLRVLNQMSTFTYVAPPRVDLEDESISKTVTNVVTGAEEGDKSAKEALAPVQWLPHSKDEITEEDKKRKRRKIKETMKKKSKKSKELVEQLNPSASSHAGRLAKDLDKQKTKKNTSTKLEDAEGIDTSKEKGTFSSSKQFFQKIQDNIRKTHDKRNEKREAYKSKSSANNSNMEDEE